MFVQNLHVGLTALILGSLTVSVAAQSPPSPKPQLRIEAGMHTANIKDISLSANGRLFATSSTDKTVRLWSLPDGKLQRVLRMPIGPGNEGKAYAGAISPDGRLVAAGGWGVDDKHSIYMFDSDSGAVVRRLGPLPSVITSLAFSADGSKLAAGLGISNGIRVWEASSGNLVAEDKEYRDAVLGLSFDSSGRLAAASLDGQLRLYSVALKLIKEVTPRAGKKPYGIAFSPDGEHLAVGYSEATPVDVVSAHDLTREFSADTNGLEKGDLSSVAWSSDGQFLFAAGTYGSGSSPIARWDNRGRGRRTLLPGPMNSISELRPWGPSEVIYGAADPAFGILDSDGQIVLQRGPPIADMRDKVGGGFVLSSDARRVRFGLKDRDQEPRLFDLSTQTLIPSPQAPADLHQADVTGLPIEHWQDRQKPKIGDQILSLQKREASTSLAIMPDKQGFILGTQWALYRFDSKGQQIWHQAGPGATWGVNLSSNGRIVVAAYDDGTIRWHRASDGRELLALFIHVPEGPDAAKRWVLWSPEGYYTASPGGEDLIGWQVDRGLDHAPDFFPAAQFRDQFYRPDIIKTVLETLDEDRAVEQANTIAKRKIDEEIFKRRPPILTLLSPKDGATFSNENLTIGYIVRSPSGERITRIRALIDGVPAEETKGLQPVADRDISGSLTVKLPPHDLTLSLITETENSESQPAIVTLKWGGRSQTIAEIEKPALYALVVGVSNYKQVRLHLKYPGKDAQDLAESLKRQKGGLYRDVSVKSLIDEQATERAIRVELDRIKRTMTRNDAVLFFFSGHGLTLPDQSTYLITYDVDTDAISATALNERLLIDDLKRFPGKVLVFLDACQSAGGLQGFAMKGGPVFDATGVANDFLKTAPGVVTFASSLSSELSAERDDLRNGIFTSALLEGLSGKADYNHDGVIETVELDHWLTDRVKQLSKGYQDAIMLKPETMKHFPVAVVMRQ